MKKGLLVIISSPSGGGKTTIIKELMKQFPEEFFYSVSMTTRKMREGEINGKDYWFVERDEFERHIKDGDLLEYETVHSHYYGTPIVPILEWIREGKIVLLDLDVLGAFSVRNKFPDESMSIFLTPPDMVSLIKRLENRSTESKEQIAERLRRVPEEIQLGERFDYKVINDILNDTVIKVKSLILKHLSN